MSTLVEVLGKIRNSGGTVTAENGQVHFKIRPGSLTDTDRAILAKHRNDVFHMLTPVDVD